MIVTVGICTWNRAEQLDKTLARMRDLRIPDGVTWEILIVNNNSPDNTDEILARHSHALPIRRLFQPIQGKSHAANMLVAHASGELILWTDDDVQIDPLWMSAYLQAADEHRDGVFFGGMVQPFFEAPPPSWLTRNLAKLANPYAFRDYGPDTRPLQEEESLVGANMMLRTEILRKYPFDTRLGPKGRDPVNGEETQLVKRLLADGHRGYWVGAAHLQHLIPAHRMTANYLRTYYHWVGRGTARDIPAGPEVPRWRGVPRWVYRRHATSRVRALALAPFRTDSWLEAHLLTASTGGMIAEYRAACGGA